MWEWKDDDGSWTPFDAKVGKKLKAAHAADEDDVHINVGKWSYKIDFGTMRQINTHTNKARPIRLKGGTGAASSPSKKRPRPDDSDDDDDDDSDVVWRWQGDAPGSWTCYGAKEAAKLEKAFSAGKSTVSLTTHGQTYLIDFGAMTQTNPDSKKSRTIQRRRGGGSPPKKKNRGRTGAAEDEGEWIKDDEFKGKSILMVFCYTGECVKDYVPKVLREIGFHITELAAPTVLPSLKKFDQVWIISSGVADCVVSSVEEIRKFVKRGGGLYVLADNDPLTQQANAIGKALHGISISGNYPGGKMVKIIATGQLSGLRTGKVNIDVNQQAKRSGLGNDGQMYAEDHEIFTGFDQVFEGITLSSMSESPDLEVILRASDENPLVAASIKRGERVLYDGGWTRMCYLPSNANGLDPTARLWFRNVAAYLQGKRRLKSDDDDDDSD